MANRKKVDYRAREAHRKNAEKAALAKKKAQRDAYLKQNGKKLAAIIVAAVLALTLVICCCKWFVSPDGHINIMFGQLRGAGDNWIVTNLAETNGGQSYFKLGTFDMPENYVREADNGGLSTDKLARAFYIHPTDETAPISSVYICGIKNTTGEEMLNKVLSYGMSEEVSEVRRATIGDTDLVYAWFHYDTTATDKNLTEEELAKIPEEERTGYSALVAYADTIKGSSVVFNISSVKGAYRDALSEDELLPTLEEMVSRTTLVK